MNTIFQPAKKKKKKKKDDDLEEIKNKNFVALLCWVTHFECWVCYYSMKRSC
ncbi:hypothetical protein Hdeb2414_s0009g00300461 [Helianthus debilis subsp. tardiflorus]